MDYIPIGVTTTLTRNVVYGLPASVCVLYTHSAPTLVQSNDSAYASSTPCTLVEGAYEVSAAFIKSTAAGSPVVLIKRFT